MSIWDTVTGTVGNMISNPVRTIANPFWSASESAAEAATTSNDKDVQSPEEVQRQYQAAVQGGMATGRQRAEQLYGIKPEEVGKEVSMTREMRKQRLEGKDPASTLLRQSRNRRLRMAKARGASPEEMSQIERQAEQDIGVSEAQSQDKRLSDYERSVRAALRGTTGTELGYGQLAGGAQYVQTPKSSGGLLGDMADTVICTELHRQGYMPDDILLKDRAYGAHIRRTDPDVYFGYLFLATPVVKAMRASRLFTKIVSYPVLAWANSMAGNGNIAGLLISTVGEPLCGLVGRLINWENRYGIRSTKA